jgi:hypothetical protein
MTGRIGCALLAVSLVSSSSITVRLIVDRNGWVQINLRSAPIRRKFRDNFVEAVRCGERRRFRAQRAQRPNQHRSMSLQCRIRPQDQDCSSGRAGLPRCAIAAGCTELINRAGFREVVARDLPQAGTQELDVLDAHARAKERFSQTGARKHFQCRGLQGGPSRLPMRPQSAFHNAWPDTMTNQFASREQSGRRGPNHEGFRI